jgi:hypothetical protein
MVAVINILYFNNLSKSQKYLIILVNGLYRKSHIALKSGEKQPEGLKQHSPGQRPWV